MRYAEVKAFPHPCNLCGSQEENLQRQAIKQDEMQEGIARFPGRLETIFHPPFRMILSHLLGSPAV